jgi:beta-aspartyl-peptidase (threonine type)
MMGKKYGRVGDSPIIGAGTYANNNTCALSATGHGEFFIRNVVTYDISALMEYKKMKIDAAAEMVINNKLAKQEALGGVIGIDKFGNITMRFNTDGMFRGYRKNNEEPIIKLYK